MNSNHQNKRQPNLRTLSIIIVIILVASGLGCHYWIHLYWKYIEWQYDWKNVEKIPGNIIPETVIPEDWVEHSLGCMSFYLPSEASLVHKINNNMVVFHYGDTQILIKLSPIPLEVTQLLDTASQIHTPPLLTLPQLRFESYRVGANDFRWSMSDREVRWHIFVMSMRSVLFSIADPQFMESLSGKDWNGVIFFKERNACLDWQCTFGSNGGYIRFSVMKEGQELDLKIVRRISQSIKVNSHVPPSP